MKIVVSFFLGFICLLSSTVYASLLNIAPESVEAAAWTILDAQSGQVIAEHQSHIQRAPASLTKMMVAYIALKEIQAGKLHLNEIITATPVVNIVQWDESQMYLKSGQQITVDQLLAGLIVMSANDAAVTLAERISGDVPHFIERMNAEAKNLGMHNTHFSNPAGVTMPDHYSTAHDLALLGNAVVNQTPQYLNYSKLPSFSFNQRFHRATNLLLKQDASVDGLKTGYTRAAGYNLALTASRSTLNPDLDQRRLIVVVLGTQSAFKRAEVAHQLLNLAYTYTRDEVMIPPRKIIAELPVIRSTLKMFKVETKQATIVTTSLYDQSTPIDLKSFDSTLQRLIQLDENQNPQIIEPLSNTQTRINIELNQTELTAPLMQAMNLATIDVYQNNQLIRSLTIENEVHIEEASFFEKMILWIQNLFAFFHSETKVPKLYPLN